MQSTKTIFEGELSIHSDKGLTLETSAFKSLYGGQFTLSTQLMKPNYLVILPTDTDHSFVRNLPIYSFDITGMLTETPTNPISTNRSTRSSRPVEILSMHSFSSPSHSSIHILSRLPHFARVTSFKKNRATEKLSLLLRRLECIAKHKGFFEIRSSPGG